MVSRILYVVRRKGLEPPTFWFVARHSIQLSYQRLQAIKFLIMHFMQKQHTGS